MLTVNAYGLALRMPKRTEFFNEELLLHPAVDHSYMLRFWLHKNTKI